MVISGPTGINIGVPRANFGEDKCTAAIFLILYLHCGWLHHRFLTTQPHHLWVRISCQDRYECQVLMVTSQVQVTAMLQNMPYLTKTNICHVTCEVTWETGTGSPSYSLVHKALSELGWSLHLALQRLQGLLCLWAQGWDWHTGGRSQYKTSPLTAHKKKKGTVLLRISSKLQTAYNVKLV